MEYKKIKKWIKTLNKKQKNKILLNLIILTADEGYIGFSSTTQEPYYKDSGENLNNT